MNRHIPRTGFLILFIAVFTGCAINPVTGQKELMLVSEGQEIEMGREFYPSALWGDIGGGGEFKDTHAKAYLKEIVTKIHSVSHRPYLPSQFAIQNSSVPNAWAIPGYVVMTRGLLAGLENEAEFAYIMGHEMGHVSARHSAQQMSYGMLQQIGLVQLDLVPQMADSFEVLRAGPADHSMNLVAAFEQKLGQVRSVLPRDAGDECSLRHAMISFTE